MDCYSTNVNFGPGRGRGRGELKRGLEALLGVEKVEASCVI